MPNCAEIKPNCAENVLKFKTTNHRRPALVPDAVWAGDMFGAASGTRAIVGGGEVTFTFSALHFTGDGSSRAKSASRSRWRALLMPQGNAGSLYCCGKRT